MNTFRIIRRLGVALTLSLSVSAAGNALAFTPFRLIGKAVASDESARSQAESQRLQMQLRTALMGGQGLGGLKLSASVFMGHAFIAGFTESQEQEDRIVAASREVPVRSLHYYLPRKTAASTESEADTDNAAAETDQTPAFLVARQVKTALRHYNALETLKLKIKVLDGVAVLAGVVRDPAEHDAVIAAAAGTPDITKVIDFLLYPEPGREKIIHTPDVPLPGVLR